MKLKINNDGYSHLLNDAEQPVYCIKRSPATTIMPDKLGQPQALVIPTLTNYCGDHCPFFVFDPSENQTSGIVFLCHEHTRGISELITENNKPKLTLLK